MLYREIIAICSQIHKKHINTLCGQIIDFLNLVAVLLGPEGLAKASIYIQHDSCNDVCLGICDASISMADSLRSRQRGNRRRTPSTV